MPDRKWTDKDTLYVLIAIISIFAFPWILSGGYVTPAYLLKRIFGG